MGYDLHITRAEHWAESERDPIAADEWLALIENGPELMIDPRNNGPYFALWVAHSVDGDHPWFDWFKGDIRTKYPDRKTLSKMLAIAKQLGATVQGDDGEVYSRPGDLAKS
jgi:hypothetical protein